MVNRSLFSLKVLLGILKKKFLVSFLIIAGIGTGLSLIKVLLNYIEYETTFDQHFPNYKNIYRIISIDKNTHEKYAGTNCFFADRVLNQFPYVNNVARVYYSETGSNSFCRNEGDWIVQKNFYYTDSAFLKLFDIQIISGSTHDFKPNTKHILINQTLKNKYFNNNPAIGKFLEYKINDQVFLLKVIGIFNDFPSNSHMQPEILAPFDGTYWPYKNLKGGGKPFFENQASFEVFTYLELDGKARKDVLLKKINHLNKKINGKEEVKYLINLQALKNVHLHSSDLSYDIHKPGKVSTIYALAAILLLLVIITVTNFLFFDSILYMDRSKEISIQKILGSGNLNILLQLIVQNLILIFISFIIGHIILNFLGPLLFLPGIQNSYLIYVLLLLLLIFISIFRYLHIKKISPVNSIHNILLPYRSKNQAIQYLLGLQLIVFILTFSVTHCINRQVQYVLSKNSLGFDYENVISVRTFLPMNCNFVQFRELKEKLLKNQDITAVSASSMPAPATRYYPDYIELEDGTTKQIDYNQVDPYFFKTLKINIVEGKDFDNFLHRLDQVAIVNKKFESEFDLGIGTRISFGEDKEIIGICQNFHSHTINTEIRPMVICPDLKWYHQVIIRINPNADKKLILGYIKQEWNKITDDPFEFAFNEDLIGQSVKEEQQISYYAGLASYIMLLILIFSLISTTIYSQIKRRKEIAIRIIHGANGKTLILYFIKKYLLLLFVASLLAIPLSIKVCLNWQSSYIEKINMPFYIFLIPGIIAGLITILTTTVILFISTNINPVRYLNNE